ncbi:MAG: ATP-binding protein [Planctomycetaceae bacterium]
MVANVLVIQGADEGLRFVLGDGAISVGRGIQNELRLNDAEVSRVHVRILQSDGADYVLEDQSSANGTLVNGQPTTRHVLKTGDQVHIGRTILVFDSGPIKMQPGAQVRFADVAGDESQIVHRMAADVTHTFVRSEDIVSQPSHGSPAQLTLLQTLFQVSEETANATTSIDEMLQSVLDLTLSAIDADRGCVLLTESGSDSLNPATFSSKQEEPAAGITISRTIANYVARNRQGVRTSDAQGDARFAAGHSIIASGIMEAICVPMMGIADFIGVIYLHTTSQPDSFSDRVRHDHAFTDQHLNLVMAVGRQLAIAVERQRYQQALVKAERFAAVGQTITMLSHHVKNILQGVKGGSYLIKTGLSQSDMDTVEQGWGIVDRNQDRIYNLVMDMLAYGADKKPALSEGAISEIAGEVCELMKGRATECDVKLVFVPGTDLPTTALDSHGIHRAILNIVTNAIEAVDGTEDATVSVGTAKAGEELIVTVRDNGPGIPSDQKKSLFSLFESTKGSRGTGLGLAVSRKIMEEHGGRIDVESDAEHGTLFQLRIPVVKTTTGQDRPTQIG